MVEEYVLLNCRHCSTQNRLLKSKAIKNIKTTVCGKCRKNIFLTTEPFFNLSSSTYEHPMDRSALEALKKVPGSGTVIKTLIKYTSERFYQILCIQNFVQVTPTHISYIHDLVQHCSKILDIREEINVYIIQDPRPNAFTFGVDKPHIGLHSSLIDLLTEEELVGVIAHELGHIQCGHVLYRTVTFLILKLASVLNKMLGGLLNVPLFLIIKALFYWYRCSELSADRAELLVTKNFDACVQTNMKLASGSHKLIEMYNVDEYLKQAEVAKELKEDNMLNYLIMMMQSDGLTHDYPVWRVGYLKDWVYDGEYLDILQGKYSKRSEIPSTYFNEEEFAKSDEENKIVKTLKDFFGFKD